MKLLGNYCFVIKEHIDASLEASNVSDSFDEGRVKLARTQFKSDFFEVKL